MFVISHRGAAGLAPENTLTGISLAKKYHVNAIEIDVRITKDGRLVLWHDSRTLKATGKNEKISDLTLKEIHLTITNSGHPIPTLEEAIEEADGTCLALDLKGGNWAEALSSALKDKNPGYFLVSSDNHRELIRFSLLSPAIEVYASAWGHAFDALYLARQAKLNGVSLSYGLFNPATYIFARRAKLKMIMFTINNPIIARLMHRLYPGTMITTDFPDRFEEIIKKSRRKT